MWRSRSSVSRTSFPRSSVKLCTSHSIRRYYTVQYTAYGISGQVGKALERLVGVRSDPTMPFALVAEPVRVPVGSQLCLIEADSLGKGYPHGVKPP